MSRIFLFATLLVAGVMSANSGHSTLKERKVLKTKKVRKALTTQGCVTINYITDCIQVTTCMEEFSEEKMD